MKKNILFTILAYFINGFIFAQNYPSGFSQVKIVDGISNPSVFAFAPDGRIFVAQQDGALRVIKNGSLLTTPAIQVKIVDLPELQESGLVGIAVDPDFVSNNYVYLYYTSGTGTTRNKISRFKFTGDVIDPSSEKTILELEPVDGKIHNGGCLKFSQDGKLFVCVGESNKGLPSQYLDSYFGKILRINPDGSAPADNPYASGTSEQSKRIWAMGLRNPFTMDIDPQNGRIFVNDVGQATWEEINDATSPGLNFGWPLNEGRIQNTTYNNPFFTYKHSDEPVNGCAVTGGTFFRPSSTNYPSEYIGKYFFIDYCDNFIRIIDPQQSNPQSTLFADNIQSTSLSLKTGPDGNLYFLSRQTGALYKIVYSLNTSPAITEQPEDLTVAVTQNATFKIHVSGVPPFFYQWKKNGVDIPGATYPTYAIATTSAGSAGKYSVVVSNASGSITSNEATLTVINTEPPVATITNPAAGAMYKAGDVINFSGTGTDAEDGTLPASAFTWHMEFFHGTGSHQHVHDGPPIAIGVKTGTYKIPANTETATDVFYRLILKVTDSEGISDTKHRDILPKKAVVSLATNPSGFKLLLDGQPRSSPFSFEGVTGVQRSLGVINYQNYNGVTYKFDRWSQGGSSTQTLVTPESNTTYTATFVEDSELRDPENPDNVAQGLMYNYYEGPWMLLPDFNSLTPVENGNVGTFSTTPKNRDVEYAFKFTGYINITSEGVYKFFTASNDGSRLYIGNRLVVDNDGQHGNQEASGTIGLKAGKHYIEVTYFQYNGGSNLLVSYSATGLSKREIPSDKLFYATSATNNIKPCVNITNPSNGQQFAGAASIAITAEPWDADGTISMVEFYDGDIKLGEDITSPYEFILENASDGDHVFTAKVMDDKNATGTSSAINVQVSQVASVKTSATVFKLVLYPNPSERSESISMDIEGFTGNTKGIIRVVDKKGNEVYSENITCNISCRTVIKVDSELKPDTYIVYVELNNKVYSKQIIIK